MGKKSKEFWNAILNSGKILSNKEAKELNAISKKLRKEDWFRKV